MPKLIQSGMVQGIVAEDTVYHGFGYTLVRAVGVFRGFEDLGEVLVLIGRIEFETEQGAADALAWENIQSPSLQPCAN